MKRADTNFVIDTVAFVAFVLLTATGVVVRYVLPPGRLIPGMILGGGRYRQLQVALPRRAMVNIDETEHPENGKGLWSWGFHAPGSDGFTLFHIDPSRSSDVIKEFLGESLAL